MRSQARPRWLVAPLVAALLILCAVPASGAPVATTSDAAGDAYKTSIAKAMEKRAAKLKACANRPKANRAACRKGANAAFATAKEKAEDARDDARYAEMSPEEKAEQRKEEQREEHKDLHECLKDKGGDKGDCK